MPEPLRAPTQSAGRFAWLDGARGVAAISVMLYHYEDYFSFAPFLSSAYLAVDLFFLMSGFVLAHSYGSKLVGGLMSTTGYLTARILRLWPMYAIATLLGVAYFLSKLVMGSTDAPPIGMLSFNAFVSLLFAPSPWSDARLEGLFPFLPAAWSLSAEMVASVAFGFALVRAGTAWLVALALAFGVLFVSQAIAHGTFDLGWGEGNYLSGFWRCLSEFTCGIILYRIHIATSFRPLRSLIPIAVVASLAVAVLVVIPHRNVALPLVSVTAIFPAFLLIAVRSPTPPALERPLETLGTLSYPIYVFHNPVLLWGAGVWKIVIGQAAFVPTPLLGSVMVFITVIASYVALRYLERPVRRGMQRVISWRRPRSAGAVEG